MFNFSDSYFDTQCNLESPNRFEPLVKKANKYRNPPCSNKPTSINGLKFASININNIRGKKLELAAFLDFYKPDVVAIQETKIDETISSLELFPDSCPYNRNLHGGGVMLLINKELPHMPLKELENDSESVWVKNIANGTSHYIVSWYREPSGSCEDFQFFRNQLEYIKSQPMGSKLPSVHVLGDFNFREIVWPDRPNKNKTMLSQSDGRVLIDIMNDHGLEQLIHFPTREENTLDLIITSIYPVNFRTYTLQKNSVTMILLQGPLKLSSLPRKNLI